MICEIYSYEIVMYNCKYYCENEGKMMINRTLMGV
jgi:hypothetical protein